MPDPFTDFVKAPDGATFAAMRDFLLAQPEYDFHSTDLLDLEDLSGEEQAGEALDLQLMPNWLLSPRAHQLLSRAAKQTGEEERAKREHYLAQACLRGLLLSGDGSAAQPYRITHPADEYDILAALDKEMSEQRVASEESGPQDVIVCTDGTELRFDIGPSIEQSGLAQP